MTLSLLNILRSGPPPPQVVLLPDQMFFTRALPVVADSNAAAVAQQVELALETLSPFPPAQLYHGFFWLPGEDRVLLFASYRRRFTTDQVADWNEAELVIPAFTALLGGDVKPDSTVVFPGETGLTAIYYDASPIPAKVVAVPLALEATQEERDRARDELLAAAPNSRHIVLAAAPAAVASRNEGEISFRAEGFASRLPATQAAALDVRDKAELAALRRSRQRDLLLWRGFLGLCAALLVLGLGELALIGAGVWDKTLLKQANAQQPIVDRVETAQMLTTRINDLSSKRLLPIEMIVFAAATKPETISFTRTTTTGLYGLTIEAVSSSPSATAVSDYRAKLAAMPEIEKLEFRGPETRDNVQTFSVQITFRPGALKPDAVTP
jgi:hypothetical protein